MAIKFSSRKKQTNQKTNKNKKQKQKNNERLGKKIIFHLGCRTTFDKTLSTVVA